MVNPTIILTARYHLDFMTILNVVSLKFITGVRTLEVFMIGFMKPLKGEMK